MKYIGPDYEAEAGIILPGLTRNLQPRQMTDVQILDLLSIFPYLSPYFETGGTNTNLPQILTDSVRDKYYLHNQTMPAPTWIVNHQFGRYPNVQMIDSAGSVVIGNIRHIDENTTELSFSWAFSGKAIFN